MKMNKVVQRGLICLGLLIILTGQIINYIGIPQSWPIPQPDNFPVASTIIGIYIIASSGAIKMLVEPSKQEKIEARDERNISIDHQAKACAYDIMGVLLILVIGALLLLGYVNTVIYIIIAGVACLGQAIVSFQRWYLQKHM